MIKTIKRVLIVIALLFTTSAFSEAPWFTGPILAPAGKTIPKGHWDFEPYVFYTDDFGVFGNHRRVVKIPDTHTLNLNPLIFYGLNDWMDIQGSFPLNHTIKNSQRKNGIGDFAITIGFQALNSRENTWIPDLRTTLGLSFPTGKYQNLNPSKQGVDGMGSGAYQTTLGLNFQKLLQLNNQHYLRARLSASYTLAHSASIRGYNAYGGGVGTQGSIRLGDAFQGDFALEYQLTQNWVPVFEINYTTRARSKFSGMPGINPSNGLLATVGQGEVDQLSFAPALEYNFNAKLGIIAGIWFSAYGRDANEFASGVIALNYFV